MNKKFMFVIIFLLVVLLATVIGVAIMAYNMIMSPPDPASAVVMVDPGGVDFMDSRIVNLSSPMTINLLPSPDGTPHAVNINVSIELDTSDSDDAELIDRIAVSEAIIRDAVIFVVSNKRIDQVAGSANQDILREEIMQRLQSEFRTNIIHNVRIWDIYFM